MEASDHSLRLPQALRSTTYRDRRGGSVQGGPLLQSVSRQAVIRSCGRAALRLHDCNGAIERIHRRGAHALQRCIKFDNV